MIDDSHLKFLRYIEEAKNPTFGAFDEHWGDPLGAQARFNLTPVYMELRPNGRLYLTTAGKKVIADAP